MDSNTQKALRLVGMARRARRIEAGEQPALRALKSGQGRLAVLAGDAAGNSERRFRECADEANVMLVTLDCTKEQLGTALGVQLCAMAVLTDAGLAKAIRDTLNGGGSI